MTTVPSHHRGGSTVTASEPTSDTSPPTEHTSTSKKRRANADVQENRRKAPKVTRACDQCKSRKARCSGTYPCDSCLKRNESCTWTARYSRGVSKIPLPRQVDVTAPDSSPLRPQASASQISQISPPPVEDASSVNLASGREASAEAAGVTSRGSPEVESAEIRGQYYDSTSGLTFVHRAWKRLSAQKSAPLPDVSVGGEKRQPIASAGDWPMAVDTAASFELPSRQQAQQMVAFYFDVCVVTYRCLHRPSVELWLETLLKNHEAGIPLVEHIGHAKAAAVVALFAIVTFRQEQVQSLHLPGVSSDLGKSDHFFIAARNLTDEEKGLPRLESVQARILQVLYLLQTARMNQSWYVFGNTLQIISALGLHRKPHSISTTTPRTPGADYINLQCRKRTFWVAYTLDKYLGVVLGRPSHYRDNDIDQEFPDRINDEEMRVSGPTAIAGLDDCHVDGLIAHAQLASIIGDISAEIYSIHRRPKHETVAAAHRHLERLHKWRTNLQPHLGAIKPSSLVPFFRRQSIALKLAYSHAIMHASRPFLLGNMSTTSDTSELQEIVNECLTAAKQALETVNSMATDGTLFYSLWWTNYVTFCALSVVYIWDIQYSTQQTPLKKTKRKTADEEILADLAERCHKHLIRGPSPVNSPSRAYNVILEELRTEAKLQASSQKAAETSNNINNDDPSRNSTAQQHELSNHVNIGHHHHQFDPQQLEQQQQVNMPEAAMTDMNFTMEDYLPFDFGDITLPQVPPMLNEWQTLDWLEFDSSAFVIPFHNTE